MTADASEPVFRKLSDEAWTVEAVGDLAAVPASLRGRTFPARVPGCVHTDLLAAGVIGHPNDDFNETEIRWIGETDWRYRCRFHVTDTALARERVDLVCDGLDTVVDVTLNDQPMGSAANLHHPHRFDLRTALRAGDNELALTFTSPLRHIRAEEARLGARPVNGDWAPYVFIRKAACNFGWDWGPKVPTSGIWRDIHLHAWDGARLAEVRPLVRDEQDGRWIVDVRVTLEWADPDRPGPGVRVHARVGEGRSEGARDVVRVPHGGTQEAVPPAEVAVPLEVKRPKLWWPTGQGNQPLYALEVWLSRESAEGKPLAAAESERWTGRVGFRAVKLNTAADERGSAFTLEVNGRPVFCKGANWIPDALLPGERTAADYRRRIEQAVGANMNMLRVWGGGIYEDPAFYAACDELGVMVWQDFMFACAAYPEEPPYGTLVSAEARHNIARLAAHPSVVLWCGGNECVWAYEGWGFKERLKPGQTWGGGFYLELLPKLMAELDPTRPYWPNSPYSGSMEIDPLDEGRGNRHTWDAVAEDYRLRVPRFVSEFGHQGPPNHATLCRHIAEDGLAIDSTAMRFRQRATGGNQQRYDEPLAERFPTPKTFDDWHYLAQLLQARAVGLGIEWLRASRPACMGALFWQLNDCWAGHSWSAIDGDGRRKPLWYAARRSFAPRMLTIHPIEGEPTLLAVNDDAKAWHEAARIQRVRFDGTVLAEEEVALKVEPRSAARVTRLADVVGRPDDRRNEIFVAEAGDERTVWFFEHDKLLAYEPPRFEATLSGEPGHYLLWLEAETMIRDIVLAVDRLDPDAKVDEQLVTLLPGEFWMAEIESSKALTLDELTRRPVFNCANHFGAGR